MKLSDLNPGDYFQVDFDDGLPVKQIYRLDHFDGMYSYCQVVDDDDVIFHWSRNTPVKRVENSDA